MGREDQLAKAATDLLARIDTERARPPATPGTHLIGGITKVGAKLEGLLRVALEQACASQGRDVSDFLPTLQGKPVSLRRATAGQLAGALENARPSGRLRILVDDLRKRESVLRRVVRLRNDAAHEEHLARDAPDALRDLRRLIEGLLRST